MSDTCYVWNTECGWVDEVTPLEFRGSFVLVDMVCKRSLRRVETWVSRDELHSTPEDCAAAKLILDGIIEGTGSGPTSPPVGILTLHD